MRYMSICSGIEAATQAWHPLGWEPVAFSEIDPFASALLQHYYPHIPNYGDMTRFQEWPDERVDLICGGTPCQAFSLAGLRKGLDDPRGNLMLTFGAIAKRYRPRWVVWENVPGVLSSAGGRDFGTFLGMLGELGYGVAFRVLNAEHVRTRRFPFAVPQRRRRVWVVGYLGDWRRAAAVLFDRESMSGHANPDRRKRPELAGEAVEDSTEDSRQCYDGSPGRSRGTGTGNGRDDTFGIASVRAHAEYGYNMSPTLLTGQPPLVIQNTNKETPFTFNGQDGYQVPISVYDNFSATLRVGQTLNVAVHREYVRLESAHSPTGYQGDRMIGDGDDAWPALSAQGGNNGGGGGALLVSEWSVRRLTPLECERLDGFPDNYTKIPYKGKPAEECPDTVRYKGCGNSWAVNCAEWIGERIEIVDKM